MFRSINLVLIAILVTLSAHSEIKTSILDFSKTIKTEIAPMEAESLWSTSLPSKNKVLEEQVTYRIFHPVHSVAIVPESEPFEKKIFIKQTQTYRSYHTQPFHLRI